MPVTTDASPPSFASAAAWSVRSSDVAMQITSALGPVILGALEQPAASKVRIIAVWRILDLPHGVLALLATLPLQELEEAGRDFEDRQQ